jgi:hypothetical protein
VRNPDRRGRRTINVPLAIGDGADFGNRASEISFCWQQRKFARRSDAVNVIQRRLLDGILCLLLSYILLVSTTYTADYYFGAKLVVWLTACRVLLLIAGAGFLISVRTTLIQEVDAIAIVLMAIILVGGAVGLFGPADWPAYLRHGFQYVFVLVFYLIGRIVARYGIPPWQMTAACAAVVSGYTIATILYCLTPGLHSGAYSFQPNLALLPVAYNVSYLLSAAAFLLILIGNKRTVFLGACFCIVTLGTDWVSRRMGGVRPAIRVAAILLLTPTLAAVVTAILSVSQLPLISMVANRFSANPSFVNTNEKPQIGQRRSSPTAGIDPSSVPPYAQTQSKSPDEPEEIRRSESSVDPIVRLTSARNLEVEAVWRLIKPRVLTGAGFGSGFEVKYISPNDYRPVSFWRDQADFMPAHVAMTSGALLSVLFTGALVLAFWKVFLRVGELRDIDRTVSLFALSVALDILLGFAGTNPVAWSAVGYAIVISRPHRVASAA